MIELLKFYLFFTKVIYKLQYQIKEIYIMNNQKENQIAVLLTKINSAKTHLELLETMFEIDYRAKFCGLDNGVADHLKVFVKLAKNEIK